MTTYLVYRWLYIVIISYKISAIQYLLLRCMTLPNKGVWCPLNVVSDGLDLRPKYRGLMHCMKSVWVQEGLKGLYQGVTPNVWGAGASWGLYFLLYVSYKPVASCLHHDISHKLLWPLIWPVLFPTLPSLTATMQSKGTQRRVGKLSWVPRSTWCLQLRQVSPTCDWTLNQHTVINNNQIILLRAGHSRQEADTNEHIAPSGHFSLIGSHGSGSCWPKVRLGAES